MPIVGVNDLTKTFSVKRKQAGLRGSLKSIAQPDFRRVEAVKGISFSLEPSELLAFIGPNGAGKSTFYAGLRRYESGSAIDVNVWQVTGGAPPASYSLALDGGDQYGDSTRSS